jgi:hypothetical protein
MTTFHFDNDRYAFEAAEPSSLVVPVFHVPKIVPGTSSLA